MPTAARPPRLEREQSRQRSLGRALTVQPLQICACWLRTAELLPYSSSSSSLPLFPVTPSSPTELSLALPYDRRVGVAVEGVSVLCSERLGNGRKKKKKRSQSGGHEQPPSLLFFPQGKKESCSGFSAVQLGARERYLRWNMQPTPCLPATPPRSHWAACYDY